MPLRDAAQRWTACRELWADMPGPSPWPCVAARGRLPGKDRTRARRLFSAAASPEGTESCGRPLPTPAPGKGDSKVGLGRQGSVSPGTHASWWGGTEGVRGGGRVRAYVGPARVFESEATHSKIKPRYTNPEKANQNTAM